MHFNSPSRHPYYLYGDPAYGLSDRPICPYSAVTHVPLTPESAVFLQTNVPLQSNGRMGFQRDDWQVGLCQHEAAAKVPLEPGRGAV